MNKKKESRPAHRPLKYGEETVMLITRVPRSKKEQVRALIKKELEKYIT